jgi:transcriptional regulator with XRE-family HTH domain
MLMSAEVTLKTREQIGSRIRRLRTEKGLGQERLAIEAGVDQSGLSKFERGKDRRMSRSSLERIASVLGLNYEQLIQGTNDEG